MRIQKAQFDDIDLLVQLVLGLWPDNTAEEMHADLSEILQKDDAAFFLAFDVDSPVGFAQCQLRHDYVEGTESSPVGYLEGIYVKGNYRKQGIARKLLQACEAWAEEKGCIEFASDCELTNEESLIFHLHMGFAEVNRIICFTKKL